MTTPAIGAVTQKSSQVSTFTLPATIAATSIPVQQAVTPPNPVAPPVYITTGNISSSPDNPGMVAYKQTAFFTQVQNDALKSATQNTAAAFNLSVTYSGDQAVLFNNILFLKLLNNIPPINTVVTQVLIPD